MIYPDQKKIKEVRMIIEEKKRESKTQLAKKLGVCHLPFITKQKERTWMKR